MNSEPISQWNGIVDMLTENEPQLTDAEVAAELAARGIVVAPAVDRVLKAAQLYRAKANLDAARRERPTVLEQLRQKTASIAENLRGSIHNLIERQTTGSLQAAYFRRLEGAASESDLRQLLADLEQIEQWSREDDAAG